MFIYNLIRLIVIACFITYFIGCMFFFISQDLNTEKDVKEGHTFFLSNEFKEEEYERNLVTAVYFALTTLSTVGYGDLYPISNREMIVVLIFMLGGVAFFSYIMGNFMDIISNYNQQMGLDDEGEVLFMWITGLQLYSVGRA